MLALLVALGSVSFVAVLVAYHQGRRARRWIPKTIAGCDAYLAALPASTAAWEREEVQRLRARLVSEKADLAAILAEIEEDEAAAAAASEEGPVSWLRRGRT